MFGALSIEEFEELRINVREAREMVQKSFYEPTIFEHGPSSFGTSIGCGIDHQHVHVVPLPFSLKRAVSSLYPTTEWHPLLDLSETKSLYRARTAYSLVQEPNGQIFWCRPPDDVRQMFRRAIASIVGLSDQFDYAAFPHLSNTLQTLDFCHSPSQ